MHFLSPTSFSDIRERERVSERDSAKETLKHGKEKKICFLNPWTLVPSLTFQLGWQFHPNLMYIDLNLHE